MTTTTNNNAPAGPNRISHDWFKAHRGRRIVIQLGPQRWEGTLLRWDLYNVLLRDASTGGETLLKQAPAMQFRAAPTKGDSR